MSHQAEFNVNAVRRLVRELIYPERSYIKKVIAYSLAISLLTLAVPIAVQTLINTVVNIASTAAVLTLSLLLFATLALSGLFSAVRVHLMEMYERHIYARLTAEISYRTLMTRHDYFEGRRNIDITSRYFDINTLQKNLPPLVIDSFALILQMLVGFTLVSFYHPVFFIFSLLIILTLFLIWKIWGQSAIKTAVGLSHAKYETAKWLSDATVANNFFKSSKHISFAREHTDRMTSHYIDRHKKHFNNTFAQTLCLLLLYAFSSSALLGMGGVLVIRGELSIGQLVAAELILTAIFFGLSQASGYLKLYYEICGAADELGMVFDLPLETSGGQLASPDGSDIEFHNVKLSHLGKSQELDFYLPNGSKVFALTEQAWLQRAIIHILKHNERRELGWVRLGGADLGDFPMHQLRQEVSVIDRSLIMECSIKQFLQMSAPYVSTADIQDCLTLVGLSKTVDELPDGLQTQLSVLGTPLQPHEFLLLKLAAALLAKTKLLIITQYFDNTPKTELHRLLNILENQSLTVIYFTNHPDIAVFDYCLCLDWQKSNKAEVLG